MGGKSSSEQQSQTQQTQSGTSNPWGPTLPELNTIISGIGGLSTAPSQAQTSAASGLLGSTQNLPNYAPQAQGVANDMLSGGPILQNAYQNYQQQLSPYANGQNLDPTQAPGMQSLLQQIRGDVGNSVNSQFAGAGRDLSGLNQQALARGISQGEAAPLLNQYNQNVQNQLGSASNLFGAGNTTQQGVYGNQTQGLGIGANIPQLAGAPAQAQLNAANTQAGLPYQTLSQILGLTLPIAGLGGQTTGTMTGTSNTQGSNQMSGAQQFALLGQGAGGFGKLLWG